MQRRLVRPVIHCDLEDIPVGVGVSELASLKWFVVFRVCQLPCVCSRDEQRWFTSRRGVVFLSFKVGGRQRPLLLLLTVNISHAVINVMAAESEQAKSTDVPCVFSMSISPLLFLTTIYSHPCLGQSWDTLCQPYIYVFIFI